MGEHAYVVRSEISEKIEKFHQPDSRVFITRASFFDRLRLEALRADSELALDELATAKASTKVTLQEVGAPLHQAFRHGSALELLHEGGVWIHESASLTQRFAKLAAIEQELLKTKRLSPSTLLLAALTELKKARQLPKFLKAVTQVEFDSIVDFTPCELQTIFCLAELGLNVRFRLQFDRKARGLLLPVQALLNEIESASGHLPIYVELEEISASKPIAGFLDAIFDENMASPIDAQVDIVLTTQFRSQVDYVCEKILSLQSRSAIPLSIAVVLRNLDERTRWFEDGFRRHQIAYKLSGHLPLRELPQAKVLIRNLKEKLKLEKSEEKATLSSFLEEAKNVANDENLSALLQHWAVELCDEGLKISLHDFVLWLEALLHRRGVSFLGSVHADAVQVLSVKQLHSKKFDHLFFVDMAQGRFPKTEFSDDVFTNADRMGVNKIFGRKVLPILYDDPLEASPISTEQAYESLWFVRAMMSAQEGLYLCSSYLDPSQREQALGEFLNAAMKLKAPVSYHSSNVQEKRQAFDDSSNKSFHLDPNAAQRVFERWLGLDPSHPLTPTRLEAFASCPFRGLVQSIFGVDDQNKSKDEIDARRMGRFVHAVLEQVFKEVMHLGGAKGLDSDFRDRIANIISQKKYLLEEGEHSIEPAILKANLLWLSLVLERAISNHLNEPPLAGFSPVLFEHRIGFNAPKLSISVDNRDVFLGGIIDRVDRKGDSYAVVDYKMSSATSLRQKMVESEILKTQFQLPLYMRLILNEKSSASAVYGYLISIRDGVSTKVLGKDFAPDFSELLMDDERSDGLVASIRNVMTPLFAGHFPAKRNLSCGYCHLKPVCRIRDEQLDEIEDEQ